MLLGSLWIVWHWIIVRLWVRLEDRSLALLLERNYPQLNNELITAVEMNGQSSADIANPAAHRAMLERVHQSATARIADVHPRELLNWQPLWAVGVATVFALVVTVSAAFGVSDWMGRWSRRLFTLSDEPWPRRAALCADGLQLQVPAFSTQLAAERIWLPFIDGVVRVPEGAAPLLQISADAQAPQVPEICTLYYQAQDGARGRANLRRVGKPRDTWQAFTLDGPPLEGLTQNMHIDVVGLDARLRDLSIEVVDPAVIAGMQLSCQYPGYLLDSLSVRAQREILEYRSGISIPEGTDVTLRGTASGQLSRVDYLIHVPQTQTPEDATADQESPIHSLACTDTTFEIPLGVLTRSQVVEVRLLDQFGLSSAEIPRYVLTVGEDTLPEVDAHLDGIGLAITANAMLPIVGTVEDDHGVKAIVAEIAINESQALTLPLEIQENKLTSTIDLEQIAQQGTLQIAPGATLGMLIAAQDYYDLNQLSHVGNSQPVQLSVVTPDQLLVMLDRQELELRQRLEQIASELEQLREVLQTLKNDLPPTASSKSRASPTTALVALQQDTTQGTKAEQTQRLSGLWAQQSILQADKSQQELSSVAARVDNLRQQLVNNRIDSYDRQERLLAKVGTPLRALIGRGVYCIAKQFGELANRYLGRGRC